MTKICIQAKNWHQFQHYGNRRPPWIKLYRSLLDDYDFHCLPIASKALAPMLWLLASENPDGQISGRTVEVAFRVRMFEDEFLAALNPLVEAGFFEHASGMLASCKHVASEVLAQSKSKSQSIRMTQLPPREESKGNTLDIYNTNNIGTDQLKKGA
jgi:hypothetical protein